MSNKMEKKRLEINVVECELRGLPDVLDTDLSERPSDDVLRNLLALHEKKARLLDELSIRPWDLFQRYFHRFDYHIQATNTIQLR